MMAKAFNQLLADGAPPSSLYNMDEATFLKTQAIFQSTEFEGVSGKVDFLDDGTKDTSGG